jgi:tetratricopeptide (TPR) repeat protein
MRLRRLTTLLAVPAIATLSVFPGTAVAATPEAERADALFQEARQLMSDGQIEEACTKFEQSLKLDPGGGTVLNLAICHEQAGKLATAWNEFQQALLLAARDKRADRQRTATEHLTTLASLVPRLHLVFKGPPPQGSITQVDGHDVQGETGSTLLLDPGMHTIQVKAQGFAPFATVVRLIPTDERELPVPALTPVLPEPAARDATAALRDAPRSPRRLPNPESAPVAPASAAPARTAGFVLTGAGGAFMLVGGYFGVRTLVLKNRSYDQGCNDQTCATTRAKNDYDAAQASAHWSTAGLGLGAVSLGIGAYLVLSNRSSEQAAPRISVRSNGTGAELALEHRF